MEDVKIFKEVMKNGTQIALATSVNSKPNVRIMNFFYDVDKKTLYFSSFKDCLKVKEIEENSSVSFTTIPVISCDAPYVRSLDVEARKSNLKVLEIFPCFKEMMENAEEKLVLFEVKLKKVILTLSMDNIKTITI